MKKEYLKNVKFIDSNGEKFNLNEIQGKIDLEYHYSNFHVIARPLISLINDSKSFVLIDLSREKQDIYKIKNITPSILEKCKEFNIELF